jgi:hypothetical protein
MACLYDGIGEYLDRRGTDMSRHFWGGLRSAAAVFKPKAPLGGANKETDLVFLEIREKIGVSHICHQIPSVPNKPPRPFGIEGGPSSSLKNEGVAGEDVGSPESRRLRLSDSVKIGVKSGLNVPTLRLNSQHLKPKMF